MTINSLFSKWVYGDSAGEALEPRRWSKPRVMACPVFFVGVSVVFSLFSDNSAVPRNTFLEPEQTANLFPTVPLSYVFLFYGDFKQFCPFRHEQNYKIEQLLVKRYRTSGGTQCLSGSASGRIQCWRYRESAVLSWRYGPNGP